MTFCNARRFFLLEHRNDNSFRRDATVAAGCVNLGRIVSRESICPVYEQGAHGEGTGLCLRGVREKHPSIAIRPADRESRLLAGELVDLEMACRSKPKRRLALYAEAFLHPLLSG